MGHPIRVLITDDSVYAREGLRALLATWPGVLVVGEAANGLDAVQLVEQCQPDIVLMDLRMPILDGVQATRRIKTQWPMVTVIMLSMYAEGRQLAVAAGADAFVVKGSGSDRLVAVMGLETEHIEYEPFTKAQHTL